MNKVLTIVLIFICSLKSFGQFPNNIPSGNASTQNYQRGASGADSGFVFRYSFTDTSAANVGFLKNVAGLVIRVGNKLYQRDNCLCKWVTPFGVDSVTVNGITVCSWTGGVPTCYAINTSPGGVTDAVDSITATTTSICQWKAGVPTCYAIVGNGVDSVTIRNNLFCQWANGDSVCYDMTGNVLGEGLDSVVVAGNNICQWKAGVETCYLINNGGTSIDSIWVSEDSLSYVYGLRNGTVLGEFSTLLKRLYAGTGMYISDTTIGGVPYTAFYSTGGGGGGISAADVGFVARNQFQPTYAIFYDNSWTTTTSNNYVVNGVTASVVSGKVEVTGNGNNYTQAYYKNQNSYLEHWQKTDTITIVSSPSATTYGITTGILKASSAVGLNVGFVDLTTGTDAGKCYIITSGGTTSATSVGAITFSQNDTLILNFKQERDTLTFTVLNKNNASTQTVQYIMTTAYVFNNVIAHARGLYGFAVKGGIYRIVGTKVENQEYVNRTLAVLGDSKTQGYYAGTWAGRYGDKLNALQLGGSGDYIVDVLSRWNDIIMLQPKQVLLSIGSNNLRGSETISNVINSYKGLVGMLNGRGIKVFHICPPEGGALSYKVYQLDSFIRRTYPLEYIDVYTTMNTMRSTLLNSDSVHINAAGNDTIYQIVNRSGLIGNPIYDQSAQQRNVYDGLNTVTVADSLNLLRNGGNTNTTELLIGAANNNFVSLISSSRKVMRFNWAPPVIFTSLNYAGSEIFRLTADTLGNTGAGNLAGINITSSGNSFYGDRAGSSITGASQSNVIVGAFAYAGLTPAASRNRNIGLGYQAGYYETRSDRLYIGSNGSSRSPLIYGDNSTGQVAINPTYVAATASTVDTSAQFEITSTNRGLLIPRLTTVQRGTIPTPATSLLIYNTTVDSFQYYQGGAWRNLGGGSGSSGITRGTTAIASGTATRVLYDSSGIVGEYSISGTGSVAMTASPTFTGTISADDISANSASLASTTTGFLPNRVTTTQMNAIASPSDGMMVYNTDEKAIFTYNSDWGWESNSLKYRTKFGTEYFNELLGIQSTAAGVTNDGNINIFASGGVATSLTATTTNRQGIIELSTSTSATGRSAIATASASATNTSMILGGGRILFETSVQIPTLSTSGERFQTLFGLSSTNNSVNIGNGVMFLYDEGGVSTGSAASANWQVYTAAASSRTFTTTSVAVTAGQWYKLTAIINAAGTSVGFYIDNVLVRTETATIPSAALGIEHQIFKSNGTTARTALVDYVYFKQKYTTAK